MAPFPFLVAVGVCACSSPQVDLDAGLPTDAALVATDASGLSCSTYEIQPHTVLAERDDSLGVLFYTAIATGTTGQDRMTLDFYFDLGAVDGPHTHSFADLSLAECHTCLMVRRGCGPDHCLGADAYLAVAGKLDVETLGPAGSTFRAIARDLVLQEVTVTGGSSEPVLDGALLCFDGSLQAPITASL